MTREKEVAPELQLRVRLALPSCLLLSWFFATGAAFSAEIPVKDFDLAIGRGAAAASAHVLRVDKDDTVRLRVTSEVAGDIHLHAYRLEAKVAPGAPAELNFKARATGRFRIEWHPAGATGKKSDHHGPPFAILEVRPR